MNNVSMKFRVKDEEHSKAIQEKLFSLGVLWLGEGSPKVEHTNKAFLYVGAHRITFGQEEINFVQDSDEEYILLDGEFVPAKSVEKEIPQGINPKQALGQASLPLNLFSPLATAYGSIGKLNGKLKYGLSNFVATPVIASIYADAIRRHLDKWMAGQEFDEADGVPHFAAMLANIDILLCARAAGTLVDDRPLLIGFEAEMEKLTPIVKALQKLHEGKNPHHHLLSEKKDAK